MSNVNPRTGIAYGVVSARNVPHLYDAIISDGTDETYDEAYKDRVHTLDREMTDEEEETFSQDYQCDEPMYHHVDGENHYETQFLGGAPLVYVTESRFVTYCRPCSPCVPGAGDLDSKWYSAGEWGNDIKLAYCPDPEDFITDYEPEYFYFVAETVKDENGTELNVLSRVPASQQFEFSVTYQIVTFKGEDEEPEEESGFEHESLTGNLEYLLEVAREFNVTEPSCHPVRFSDGPRVWWSSFDPVHDRRYFEQGEHKTYSLHVKDQRAHEYLTYHLSWLPAQRKAKAAGK